MENTFQMACRVCGVTDDAPGEDVLEPDGYDLEWIHDTCREEQAERVTPTSWPSGQAVGGGP